MAMAMRMVLVLVFVACVSAQVMRPAPYSVSVTAGKSAIVLSTQNYIVSLESNPCAITVRHLFSNPVGHLVWTANYYVGSLVGATKCTLKLTATGDLQLLALFKGTETMIWNSKTAGKGVTKMALENSYDSGDFQLLTASNQIEFSSFGLKEFSILPTQKLRLGEQLVAPDKFFTDSTQQVLFSGGRYFLKLVGGDLRLFSDFGNGQKQYWSLQATTIPNTDLSQVTYASIVTGVGGIGLYKNNGALVWTSGKIGITTSNPHDTYFRVDPDGNLKTYVLVKGNFWSQDFVAIPSLCDLPNACGEYGVCSNNQCSCLPYWVPVNANDKTQGCKTLAPFVKCGSGRVQFLSYTGYDYVYNRYATGLKLSKAECDTKCYGSWNDCGCLAYFYDANTGLCYLITEVHTFKKVADAKKSVHIKV